MCKYLGNCSVCLADKSECEEMGDGSPICKGFICGASDTEECVRHFSCISYEEELDMYNRL